MRRQGWRARVEERLSQLDKQDTGRFLAIEMRLARLEMAGTNTKPLSALFEEEYASLAAEQNTPSEAEAAAIQAKEALDKTYIPIMPAVEVERRLNRAVASVAGEFADEINGAASNLDMPAQELAAKIAPIKRSNVDMKPAIAKFLAGESGRPPYIACVMERPMYLRRKEPWMVMNGDDQLVCFCSSPDEAEKVINGEIELDVNFGLGKGMLTVELKQPEGF